MSAYVSRLIQRFMPAGEPADSGPLLNPFVRSRSPIAAMDQRFGVDEQLGAGPGGLEPPSDEMLETSLVATPRMQIQRKAAGPVPRPPTQQPNDLPVPSLEPPKPPSGFVPLDSPQPTPAATAPETSSKPTLAKPPLDPGPLFDPVPRYFDEVRAPEPLAPMPPIQSELMTTSITEVRAIPASPRPESARPSKAVTELRPLSATVPTAAPSSRIVEHHWGWLETAMASAAPQLMPISSAPERATPERASSPAVQLYILPRPRVPEPLITEPVEYPYVEAPSLSPMHKSSPPARQTQRSAPTSFGQPPRRNPGGKLTIDSISLIGPLDRHFPNRRNFRLRYR